jgi:hypothetical protein
MVPHAKAMVNFDCMVKVSRFVLSEMGGASCSALEW